MSVDVQMPADVEPPAEILPHHPLGGGWSSVSQVNLLPDEIVSARNFRRLQRQLAGVVLGVVLLGAAGGAWAQSGVLAAQSDLTDAQATTSQLQQQQARYAAVPKALAQLDAARAARQGAMSTDVLWYRFLGDLALNTPANTDLSSVAITMTAPSTSGATSGAGAASAGGGLGQVAVSGNAARFRDVAEWLDSVTLVHGLASPSLQTAAQTASTGPAPASAMPVNYSANAVITAAALSHRYDRKAG